MQESCWFCFLQASSSVPDECCPAGTKSHVPCLRSHWPLHAGFRVWGWFISHCLEQCRPSPSKMFCEFLDCIKPSIFLHGVVGIGTKELPMLCGDDFEARVTQCFCIPARLLVCSITYTMSGFSGYQEKLQDQKFTRQQFAKLPLKALDVVQTSF